MSGEVLHVGAATGPAYLIGGCTFRFLATSEETAGGYTTMEITVPPGEGADPHSHADEDEHFYVLEGELTFELDGEAVAVAPGDFLHVPRGVVHAFANGPRQARLLATFVPGTGIDRLIVDAGVSL